MIEKRLHYVSRKKGMKMIDNLDNYRMYLQNAGYYMHHRASCRQFEYELHDSYVSIFYKGRFGEGIKIMYCPFVGARYLTVEYWIKGDNEE